MHTPYAEDSGQIRPRTATGVATYDFETIVCWRCGGEASAELSPHFTHHAVCAQALQETVACMCTVVQNLTHDFVRLVALAKSCNGTIFFIFEKYYFAQSYDILDLARLQQALARPATQKMTPVEARTLSILIFIVSLLSEHCNFDRLRLENDGAQH